MQLSRLSYSTQSASSPITSTQKSKRPCPLVGLLLSCYFSTHLLSLLSLSGHYYSFFFKLVGGLLWKDHRLTNFKIIGLLSADPIRYAVLGSILILSCSAFHIFPLDVFVLGPSFSSNQTNKKKSVSLPLFVASCSLLLCIIFLLFSLPITTYQVLRTRRLLCFFFPISLFPDFFFNIYLLLQFLLESQISSFFTSPPHQQPAIPHPVLYHITPSHPLPHTAFVIGLYIILSLFRTFFCASVLTTLFSLSSSSCPLILAVSTKPLSFLPSHPLKVLLLDRNLPASKSSDKL